MASQKQQAAKAQNTSIKVQIEFKHAPRRVIEGAAEGDTEEGGLEYESDWETRCAAMEDGLFQVLDGAGATSCVVSDGVPMHEVPASIEFCVENESLAKSLSAAIGQYIVKYGGAVLDADREREYQYELRVNGQLLLTGDEDSVGVIFGNLDGRNFVDKPDAQQVYENWLAYMRSAYKAELKPGQAVEMRTPEGAPIFSSGVGTTMRSNVLYSPSEGGFWEVGADRWGALASATLYAPGDNVVGPVASHADAALVLRWQAAGIELEQVQSRGDRCTPGA